MPAIPASRQSRAKWKSSPARSISDGFEWTWMSIAPKTSTGPVMTLMFRRSGYPARRRLPSLAHDIEDAIDILGRVAEMEGEAQRAAPDRQPHPGGNEAVI